MVVLVFIMIRQISAQKLKVGMYIHELDCSWIKHPFNKPMDGLLWHTDRGSQYASDSHRKILSDHNIIQSMSRKWKFWDNAVSESFFHSLKTELTHHCRFKTRVEAKQAIFEYIEVFYNRERLHSANDYLSPVDYEIQQEIA